MDEEMEIINDLVAEEASCSDEIDFDYEFDAKQFFDFTVDETESEAEEAENWFRFACEYPPSPFIVKLKLMKAAKATQTKAHKTSASKMGADKKSSTSSTSDGDIDNRKAASREVKNKGVKHHNRIPQDRMKSKSTVNLPKPNGSSFMKPTASHLAKKTKECDIHSGGSGRLQKSLASAVEKLHSPIRSQNQATKRQKLEIGYLRKVAQLKHRTSFLHKFTSKAAHLEGGSKTRVKSTTIRKSALVMKERAQRHRSQNKSESVQQPKANTQLSRARSLNRKTLDPPRLPQCKKSISQSTEFQPQVLNKHNSAPLASDNSLIKSQNSLKKDKCGSPINLKACTTNKVHPVKDGGLALNAKHNPDLPLTELFEKLSLKCESETKVLSSSRPPSVTKALKENVPIPFQQDFRRCVGKPDQRGTNRRVTEVKI